MADLSELRVQINEIDSGIEKLFIERMNVSAEIAKVKTAMGKPIYDPVREQEKIQSARDRMPEELKDLYEKFLLAMMDVSKDYQKKVQEKA